MEGRGRNAPIFIMTIRINDIEWCVVYTYDEDNLRMADNTIRLGVTDRDQKVIYINAKLSGDLLLDVIRHEICHAFVFSYDYYLSVEEEEFLCEFVAKYSYDILNEADKVLSRAIYIVRNII